MARLTEQVIDNILRENEGYTAHTHYDSRNFSCDYYYTIHDGDLYRRDVGDTSWSDSDFDVTNICDYATARRFIKNEGLDWNLD